MLTLWLLLGAGCGYDAIEEHPCPTGGTTLTYESFGRDFLASWCQRCHGAAGPYRKGAPSNYDFGTQRDAQAWAPRIFARSAMSNTTMPPGPDDPPEADRKKLADWLACGAL
ncbi:MAG: cytochrome c [Myxococcota bacterium]